MSTYIFINPSPNMERLAKAVQNTGRSVSRVFTKEYVPDKPCEMWAFIGGNHHLLTERTLSEIDSSVTNVKKPLFASFKQKKIKSKLAEINPEIKTGTYQDHVLLRGQLWSEDTPSMNVEMTYEQAMSRYHGATVITSRHFVPTGKSCVTFWRTDFDIREALGNEYFFFFDELSRNELYCVGDELMTITDSPANLDWLKKVNPTMARFAFEKVRSYCFQQNKNQWIEKHSNVFLLNDYSWQGVSVRLPDTWERAALKIICTDKKK